MTEVPPTDPTPRPIITAFATAMERTLARHDAAKGEWKWRNAHEALEWLREKFAELVEAVDWPVERFLSGGEDDWTAAVRAEAADVALCALIVADCCGTLPFTTDRGRRW